MHLDPRDVSEYLRMSHETRGPVPCPPPIIYLAALLVGLALDRLWPSPHLPAPLASAFGTLLVIASAAIVLPAFLRFRRAGTSFDVRKPATALVTSGPYRFSRNPGYVSLTLLYLGVGLLLNNIWVLLLVMPTLLVMDQWVVRREERHLEERFGEDYERYKRSVRRWL